WTMTTDYSVPVHNWIPICGVTMTPDGSKVMAPAAGGTILVRTSPDFSSGTTSRVAFFGLSNYNSNPSAWNSAVHICTPISSDAQGNLYFGYISTGAALPGYPSGVPSGLARISTTGVGIFASVTAICGDSAMAKVAYNC